MTDKYRYKKGKRIEDTTKGKSYIMPRTYKQDVLVQVWLESRELATFSLWLDSIGCRTRFLSEVVRESLKLLMGDLIESGEVNMIEDTAEARELLEGIYRVNLNRGDKGKKNALHNLVLSDRIASRKTIVREPKYQISEEEAMKLAMEYSKMKNAEVKKESKQKDDMVIVDPHTFRSKPLDDKEVVVKQKMTDKEFEDFEAEDRRRLEEEKKAWDCKPSEFAKVENESS